MLWKSYCETGCKSCYSLVYPSSVSGFFSLTKKSLSSLPTWQQRLQLIPASRLFLSSATLRTMTVAGKTAGGDCNETGKVQGHRTVAGAGCRARPPATRGVGCAPSRGSGSCSDPAQTPARGEAGQGLSNPTDKGQGKRVES